MKLLLLLLCSAITLCSQRAYDSRFILLRTSSLSSSTETLTVQQSAAGTMRIRFISASAYCSAACTVTFSRDGTAASTTTLAPVALSGYGATATAAGYRSSNVGAGTTISVPHEISAGTTMAFDLTGVDLVGAGTSKNLSMATNSITGTVKLQIIWREE